MSQTKSNIVMIGMPASGKSTVGIILAKALGYDFIDGDLLIQKTTGKKLDELMGEIGTQAFLDLESRLHQNITAERTVIAPGGSVVMEEEAMRHLQEIGTIVYLQMDLDMALDRLHDPKKRGVVLEEGETIEGVVLEEGETIESLYYKRLPLYEKYAEITVNERGHALEDLVIQILTKLHGH